MPGFDSDPPSQGGSGGGTLYATNVDFTGSSLVSGTPQMVSNGQLLIGSASTPRIRVGTLTSPLGTISIGYSAPNITLDLAGGSVAVEQVTLDGAQTIVPSGSPENITATGNTVANATHSKSVFTNKNGASSFSIDVQVASALAATDITKTGLANFNSTQFTVDANGFVSTSGTGIGNTITGDSGGALSPTAGNWNILGRSGSKTSGSGSTLTVKSPPFSQVGASATSVLNSGEFVTAAVTRTLPATGGVTDGDLVIYYCTTAGALVVTGNTGQTIRIGSAVSSSAGTATSTAIGDSLTLRFDATAVSWRAVSVVGNWTLA